MPKGKQGFQKGNKLGHSNKGRKMSSAFKKAISLRQTGRKLSENWKRNISESLKKKTYLRLPSCHSQGYILIYNPKHIYCNKDGYIPEHRFKLECELGIIINPVKFIVHHKDGNKKNNKINNLQLLTRKDHRRLHEGWLRKMDGWYKHCHSCGVLLKVCEDNFYKRKSGKFISWCKNCNKNVVYERRFREKERRMADECSAQKRHNTLLLLSCLRSCRITRKAGRDTDRRYADQAEAGVGAVAVSSLRRQVLCAGKEVRTRGRPSLAPENYEK
ncbi:MAG: HNH endonuclease [Patescibacteria group bacterium]